MSSNPVKDAGHLYRAYLLTEGLRRQVLGHSQLSQTQRYTHVTAELTQDAADRMGEALWGYRG